LKEIIPVEVKRVESLGTGNVEVLLWDGKKYPVTIWREDVDPTIAEVVARFEDGPGAIFRKENVYYLAFWPDREFLLDLFEKLMKETGHVVRRLPEGVRIQKRGDIVFAFNFTPEEIEIEIPEGSQMILGDHKLPPYSLAIWKETGR